MPDERTAATGTRYHSLDGLRAAAMLLGVAWHAMPGFGSGAVPAFMDWLHSFRMPLFMLISGFFGHMILEKYGLRRYFAKRWSRIGLPMLIGLFTFMPIYHWYGPMAGMFPGPGGPGAPDRPPAFPGGPSPGPGGPPGPAAEMPPPPPGMIPPPFLRFDTDSDGSLSQEEWREAQKSFRSMFERRPGSGGPPGFGPPGFRPPANRLNQFLFGETGRLFSLGHLWFLWYLLVFVTVAPVVSGFASWATTRVRAGTDMLGDRLSRYGLAPLVLGLISLPCLMLTSGFIGWGLPLASGIGGQFPDFFFQYQPDWPFYFAYFMAGWWLYRDRGNLPALGRIWLPLLVLGVTTYIVAGRFSAKYQSQTKLPSYEQIRVLGYGFYAVAAAYTSWGLIGLFQRHFDRPSRVGRYFSETALWIYLVHQDILGPVIRALRPLGLSSLGQGLLATTLAIAIAVILYEVLVRPTPLAWIFGPGQARSGQKAELEPSVPSDEITTEDQPEAVETNRLAESEEAPPSN